MSPKNGGLKPPWYPSGDVNSEKPLSQKNLRGLIPAPGSQNQVAIPCNQWFCLPNLEVHQTVLISAEGKS